MFHVIFYVSMAWAALTLPAGLGILLIYTKDSPKPNPLSDGLDKIASAFGEGSEEQIFESVSAILKDSIIHKAFVEGGLLSAVIIAIISAHLH